ncbi:MAG: bifunctional fucokinase/L-fucose-1-P-guanylyltransferase [Clostridia bacterium]|nr:bifunctional fucokinase/L-fucose-1-P-guanylyltransferase [Clostridia bacterium]
MPFLSLYMSQAYHDSQEDYNRALNSEDFPYWDYIILTASNENQAAGFRAQLNCRQLPAKTKVAVIPDEGNVRVGSGGATLSVIRYIMQQEGHLDHLRILVIHSGGNSMRVPQYSALGKLFSPVPHELTNGNGSTLFDEFLITTASIPSRIQEGMLLLSGDVLLLFNPLSIRFSGHGATAISFSEDAEIGKNHGVYLCDDQQYTKRFLHKQSIESLTKYGAIEDDGTVKIDTGAVLFGSDLLQSLYSLIDTDDKYFSFVNDKVRLSLYGDFQYPLAGDSTLEDFYNEQPEGTFTPELKDARTAVWNALSRYKLKVNSIKPAKFIHFGTSKEILDLMSGGIQRYADFGWQRKVRCYSEGDFAAYNSIVESASVGENCYFEESYVHSDVKIGKNCILSFVELSGCVIPDNTIVHSIKLTDGRCVTRLLAVSDNPKSDLFFGVGLAEEFARIDVDESVIWPDTDKHTLWTAKLYPVCDTAVQSVDASLDLARILSGAGDVSKWRASERMSLEESFAKADLNEIINTHQRTAELVNMDQIAAMIKNGQPASDVPKFELCQLTEMQKQWLERKLASVDGFTAMRYKYYIGTALGKNGGEKYVLSAFKQIQDCIFDDSSFNLNLPIDKEKLPSSQSVHLPLRVNFGGGWSDTPPYCNENGGTVLNAAISLEGELPVQVTITKTVDNAITFISNDMDVRGTFESLEDLQNTGDPFDAFALQKAALIACGIVPRSGGTSAELFEKIGGFTMQSEVQNTPKGSGLGTSSILAAACAKCIFEYFGISYTDDMIYDRVLCMEQIMSTGGGWQDQVGGLTGGFKLITTEPGIQQNIRVSKVTVGDAALRELNERFALIYTGQRRLARNLLRDVIGRYIGNDPVSLKALSDIKVLAQKMRIALEEDNFDLFAKLLNEHWTLSCKIDSGTTNSLIDRIFDAVNDLVDGKMICGAGGGGFLQVILKKGVTKKELDDRLKMRFADSDIRVRESAFIL